MTDIATQARATAVAIEVKKDGLQQRQDGTWKLTLTVLDMPAWLMAARMGTRMMAALVEIGDNEEPVSHESPAPAVSPGACTASGGTTTGAVPGRDAARERGRERYLMADDGEKAVTRAALLCRDKAFQAWLRGHYLGAGAIENADDAGAALRYILSIESRRQLASSERAYNAFRNIEFQFHGHAEVRG